MIAPCLACNVCQTEEEYCAENPDTPGCPTEQNCDECVSKFHANGGCECIPPNGQCEKGKLEALIPEGCDSCGEEAFKFCSSLPDDDKECNNICCNALIAPCLACSACQSEEEYCAEN